MKKVSGYIRSIPGGTPLTGIDVTIKDANTGTTITAGGMAMGTTNPITTDATTGLFEWSCELSPGPLLVEADTGGGNFKRRAGKEVMQSGDLFFSDLISFYNIFSTGVVDNLKNEFTTTASALNLTVQTGAAVLKGYLFETATNRVIAVPSNSTLAERWDLLILRQHVGGTYSGKQEIALVVGTVNQTDPTLNADPNIYEFAIYRSKLANGGSTPTLTDLRSYASATIGANQVTVGMLTGGGDLSTSEVAKILKAPASGLTPAWAILNLGELNNVSATAPSSGQALTWNGSLWVPTTLSFAAVSHTHPADDIVSGLIGPARLGTGTSNSTTFLRGDQTWQVPPGLGAHSHDLALPRLAVANHSFDSPVGPLTGTESLVDSFTVTVSSNHRYGILAHAAFEGYADSGATAKAQLGIEVGGSGIVWGSSVSTENESGVVAATASDEFTTAGTTVTVNVWARRSAGTGNCYVRSGHAFGWAISAQTLGVE